MKSRGMKMKKHRGSRHTGKRGFRICYNIKSIKLYYTEFNIV